MALLVVAVALVAGSCGRTSDEAQNPDARAGVGGSSLPVGPSLPVDVTLPDPGSLPPGSEVPATTVPAPTSTPKSIPKATPKVTTTKPPVTPTTKPVTPTTPRPTTTRAPVTTTAPPTPQQYCDYAATINFKSLSGVGWATQFGALELTITNALPVAPPEVKQPLRSIKAVLDQAAPAVAAGQINSVDDFGAWVLTLDKMRQANLVASFKAVEAYTKDNCH